MADCQDCDAAPVRAAQECIGQIARGNARLKHKIVQARLFLTQKLPPTLRDLSTLEFHRLITAAATATATAAATAAAIAAGTTVLIDVIHIGRH